MTGLVYGKRVEMKLKILIFAIFVVLPVFQTAHASVDWFIERQIELDSQPLDVTTSEDGSLMFVLVPGEIVVYELPEGNIAGRIAVSRVFDGIEHSQRQNRLILKSSSSRALRIIRVDVVWKITTDGLPFRGPRDAAVTIVVFDDYQ